MHRRGGFENPPALGARPAVRRRDELGGDVAEDERPVVRRHDGMVDRRRQPREHAALEERQFTPLVLRPLGDPVASRSEVLEHERFTVAQTYALEPVPRLAGMRQRLARDDVETGRQRCVHIRPGARLRSRRVRLLAHDALPLELKEVALAPDLVAGLSLQLDRKPGRKLLDVPAQQRAGLGPPRSQLSDDRFRPRQRDAPAWDEGVEERILRVPVEQRLEVRRLVTAPEDVRIHRQNETMTEAVYQAIPEVASDERAPHAGTVVMKFGGTSVSGPERLKAVARRLVEAREAGNRVVGVLSAMGDTTDELLDLAREMSERPDPRELDMLISVGERISCALAAMAIVDLGQQAISLTGSQAGIVTDTVHGKAKIVEVRAKRIHDALDAGRIVLVAGFQGVSNESLDITTLGRGGTDLTAVALAAALGADSCEIYTDVQGVFTADPRIVPEAQKLHAVSYDEMLEMAASGAKVLQLRSVEFARNHNVRLHVRSTFADADGTWITEEEDPMLEKAMISGVVHTREELVYDVKGVGGASLFEALAVASVNVDTIVQISVDEIVFSAPTEDRADIERTLASLGADWSSRDDLGKVSVVGAGMKSHPGIAAKTFATLREQGVEPAVVTTSPIKIACHIPTDDVEKAVHALHEAFDLA